MALQQLQTEIQNELITLNQLTQLIMAELKAIKMLTGPGEDLEANVQQNVSLIEELAVLKRIDLRNVPTFIPNRLLTQRNESDQ